jgi:cell division protein FtsN
MCGEARASRKMLIALVAASVVCVVIGLAQMVVGKKEASLVADMRVEKLRQKEQEDWEESTEYESVRGVERA